MEGKKQGTKAKEKAVPRLNIGEFIGEMKAELAKVTWTSREEMQVYIKVVVISTLLFGFGIYGADLLIQGVLNGLGVLVRLIAG